MINFIVGFVFSLIIAFAAYKRESLSLSGSAAAVVLGTAVYGFGGLFFSIIMVGFFASSSLVTKFKELVKGEADEINEKGGKRDYTQVIANGLGGFVYALLFYITKNHIFILGFASAFAACNSDTWASEIGALSKGDPISIINFKPLKKGLSGGISPLGTAASALGSLFISLIFILEYSIQYGFKTYDIYMFILCALGGFLGSIIDSVLGAAVQSKYYCDVCKNLTEKKIHHGKPAKLVKGTEFFNNNMVNLISSVLATFFVLLLYMI